MGNSRFEGTISTVIQRGISEYGQKRDVIERWMSEREKESALIYAFRHSQQFLQLCGVAGCIAGGIGTHRLHCSEMIRVIREEKSLSRLYQEYNKIVDDGGIPERLSEGELKDLDNLVSTLLDEAESVIYHIVQYPSNLRWSESCLEFADELVNHHPNNHHLKERIERLKSYMFSV